MDINKLALNAINAALLAGKEIVKIYNTEFDIPENPDREIKTNKLNALCGLIC